MQQAKGCTAQPVHTVRRPPGLVPHTRAFHRNRLATCYAAPSEGIPSNNRRTLLLSSGLFIAAAADKAAADDEEQQAAAAAAGEHSEHPADAAAAQQPPAPGSRTKPRKRRKQVKQRQPAPLKPVGTVPAVKLGSGLEVSKIIRGCWQLDGQHKGDQLSDRTSGAAAIEDLDVYLKHGIFTLDTADNYGPSEAIIGQHMRLNPAAASKTKVLTKLSFMTPPTSTDLRKDNLEYRVRSSIARLGVTTLDLVQLHWEPALQQQQQQQARGGGGRSSSNTAQPGFVTAAKVLQQLQTEGLIRHLGVSNFDVPMLMALSDAGVTPASNQVSYSVIDRRPALFLSRFCEARQIPLLCYGTLAGGLLSERYKDMAANMVRIDTISKARYGTMLKQLGGWSWLQDMLAVLHDIGMKHGVSASCVAARWVLQQDGVAALVLGARNTSHLRDTQRIFSFELDEMDMLDIDAAYEGAVQPSTDVYVWERGGDW